MFGIVMGVSACASSARVEAQEQTGEESVPAAGQEVLVGSADLEAYTETIPGTPVVLEMAPVPGGTMTVETAEGTQQVEVKPFWMSRVELPWEIYDVFTYELDKAQTSGSADALSRPSKPYMVPGESFGHASHPALAMSAKGANAFVEWLSAVTGNRYRLPTEDEWEFACKAGRDPDRALGDVAWYGANAGDETHEVGSLAANGFGLHDLLGNAAEWVVGRDGTPVIKGGSWRDEAENVTCTARQAYDPNWQTTDPQLPKSTWWFSDAPFLGIRVVRDAE